MFQDPDSSVRFMVSNQQTGGMGVTWTAATLVLYFSNSFSYQDRVQSEDRCHGRLSKIENKVTYVDIYVKLAVEGLITRAQAKKASIAGFVGDRLTEGAI